ncbi:MAG: hypothetical protein UV79_C0016G0003 [candidate division TM6 bacterium GW2011_GWF2_43_17]|nr:MAG: hypothetical protein UV79_C0016G0003 [candidate division TM6 bacterium GW2011_GWF2_43_17]HAU30649.1 hypothetical protein [Candidatus Dependentiae bacterium]
MKNRSLLLMLLISVLALPLDAGKKKLSEANTRLNIARELLTRAKEKESELSDKLSKMTETTQSERSEKEKVTKQLQDAIQARENAFLYVENLNKQIIALSIRIKAKEEEAASLKVEKDQLSKEKKQIETKLQDAVYKNQQVTQTKKKLQKETSQLKGKLKKLEEEKALLEGATRNKQKELQEQLKRLKVDKKNNKISSQLIDAREKENQRLQEEIKKVKENIQHEQNAALQKQAASQETITKLQEQLLSFQVQGKESLAQFLGLQTKANKLAMYFVDDFKGRFNKALEGFLTQEDAEKLSANCSKVKDLLAADRKEYYLFLADLAEAGNTKLITLVNAGELELGICSGLVGLPAFIAKIKTFSQNISDEIQAMKSQIDVFVGSADQETNLMAGLTTISVLLEKIAQESERGKSDKLIANMWRNLRSKAFEIGSFKNPVRANASLTKSILQGFLKNDFGTSSIYMPGLFAENSAFDLSSEL